MSEVKETTDKLEYSMYKCDVCWLKGSRELYYTSNQLAEHDSKVHSSVFIAIIGGANGTLNTTTSGTLPSQ